MSLQAVFLQASMDPSSTCYRVVFIDRALLIVEQTTEVECYLNPLSARAFFWGFFKKYRKFDCVTQFFRNGSTKIQSFVYHFVASFILFQKLWGRFSWFCLWKALRRLQAKKLPIYLSSAVKGLKIHSNPCEGSITWKKGVRDSFDFWCFQQSVRDFF